ncbi:alpha/beta hydrolase [Acinetobacter cumulans]|uniref:Alpha/beta hydrolase n=1 Tax=Acinetobacter cumulans TaxID=2136182 RepID=A0A3A8G895_9GAMM|nr:alpha/beta hydrolase [Acinetobacter cumulans]RKG54799.1 alpha/beta hydrolase [Acinetobacter cumulans]
MDIQTQQYQVPFGTLLLNARSWQSVDVNAELAPIILLHDSLGSVDLWRDLPAQLAHLSKRKVYAYDRLGFGLSDACMALPALDFVLSEAQQAFQAVIDYFQLSHFVVMGHSVGGAMAFAIAAQEAERCVGLVSIAAQFEVEEQTLQGIMLAKKGFQQAGQLERLEKYHPQKAQWVLDAWTETWLAPEFQSWNLATVLPKVSCPSLIIHGELDEYGSVNQAQQLFDGVDGRAEMHILEGLHHLPHKEQPELVLQIIQEFLNELF